tara:strand:- start:41 stop:904 length:864 start_codon:yes stop_codon:yes gene_type:complete
MDEVDLLLHPLKSELNFPIGQKLPLDFSPERWLCAIHALDAIFYHSRRTMSVGFSQSGRAHQVLDELSAVITTGFEQRMLQASPHLVLLSTEWYSSNMKPLLARWMLLWLESHHLSTPQLSTQQLLAYLTGDGSSLVPDASGCTQAAPVRRMEATLALEELHLTMASSSIDQKSFQLLNLTREWLITFLPHCLQKARAAPEPAHAHTHTRTRPHTPAHARLCPLTPTHTCAGDATLQIDRVTFGLLSTAEHEALLANEPHMPRSRLKLAIPFLGKDCPSRASEFAHP